MSLVCAAVMAALLIACNQNPASPKENPTPPGMRHITGGTFQMGSTTGFPDEQPVHTVTVSSFYMDTTDVTQADYVALVGENPSLFTGNSRRPVEQVTWYDAVLYCNARSKRDHLDTVYSYLSVIGTPGNGCTGLDSLKIDFSKKGYHLPTEAQWEYACRAGSTTAYFWGDDSTITVRGLYSWYYENSPDSTQPVATKLPNAWGLYDMSGNVFQWCNDWYDYYKSDSAQTDPTGPSEPGIYGYYHVVRGGSWLLNYGSWHVDGLCRSAARATGNPGYFYQTNCLGFGFRCAR